MLRVHTRAHQIVLLGLFLLAFSSSQCFANFWMDPGDVLSDTLYAPSQIITGGSWGAPTSFYYEVTRPSNENLPLHYKYAFTPVPDSPSWSHFILQVSNAVPRGLPAFDVYNPMDFTGTGVEGNAGLFGPEPTPGWQSNPGIPQNIFGIKFDTNGLNTVEFDSYRLPMAGDFYIKGGPDSYAFNNGFGNLNGVNIPVPNSSYVPVPGAVLLGLLGLSAAGIKLRKFA